MPCIPSGITKSKIAWLALVPELLTVAGVPGSPVVTLPICTVAVTPAIPAGPVAPCIP